MAPLPGNDPATSHATCRSPTAWTVGTLIAASAARRPRLPGGLFSRRRRPIRDPVLDRPAARRIRRPGPDDLRRRLPRRHGHLQRRDPHRAPDRQAGLRLEILRHWWRNGRAREDHGVTVSGRHDWAGHEVTALVPEDADIIRFGIALTGPGRIALRNPTAHRELRTAESAD